MAADAQYKIILLGDPGVGKTTWFLRIKHGEYMNMDNSTNTMGVEHLEYKITVQGKDVKVGVALDPCLTLCSERGALAGALCMRLCLLCMTYVHVAILSA